MMSFATKLCSSFIQSGYKFLVANKATTSSAHRFHAMVNPLPKSKIEVLNHNPIASNVVSPLSINAGFQRLLAPVSSLINQISGFKVKGSLRRRCKDCYFVVRERRRYVICPTHPRHKQMSMKKRDYKTWILTHATQSKIRPW